MSQQLFQINEDDLTALEHTLPLLQDALMPAMSDKRIAPRLQVQLTRVKAILSNIRWNYGPPLQVKIITEGDDQGL